MSRKTIFYIVFFIVLVTGFYFVMVNVIPGFGRVKLPVLSYVEPFKLTNQDGRPVTERELEGKVYLVEYFYTTCKSICPYMNNNMKKVYEQYKGLPGFLIVSYTSDPGTDSAQRLKTYADSLRVDTNRWWFLTGQKDSLYRLARNSYKLDDPKNNLQSIDEQFIHTQIWALVDKNGQVRKYYDGLKSEEIKELEDDIPALIKEPAAQKRFVNNLFTN